jgi:hypothetical protein
MKARHGNALHGNTRIYISGWENLCQYIKMNFFSIFQILDRPEENKGGNILAQDGTCNKSVIMI